MSNTEEPFRGYVSPKYTQIPDLLFDEQLPVLSGAELKVLLYVMRRTFGFKKDADNISINQIATGITTRDGTVLDRGTGLSKSTVQVAIKGLVEKRIVITTKRVSPEHGNEATTYQLNLGDTPYTENRYRAIPKIGIGLYRKSAQQDTEEQETDSNISNIRKQANSDFSDRGENSRNVAPTNRVAPLPNTARSQMRNVGGEPNARKPARDGDPATGLGHDPTRVLPLAEAVEHWRKTRSFDAREPSDERTEDGGRREDANASGPDGQVPTIDRRHGSRGGRPPGSREHRDMLRAYLADFMREFNDQAPLGASITRALHLFAEANIAPELWGDYLYQARSLTKENVQKIHKKVEHGNGGFPTKNQAPYFFSILSDLLGLRSEAITAASRSE